MSAIERVELKSCPFCGGEAQPATVVAAGIEWAHVECVEADCDAVGPAKPTEAEAIAAWNTALAKSACQGDVVGAHDAVERVARAIAKATVLAAEPEKIGRLSDEAVDALVENLAVKFFPEARAALAAVPAGAEMREGWQTIETAPKDGRYVIAARFGPDQELRWVMHSRWVTAEECAECYGGSPREYEAGWTAGDNEDDDVYPTHWQPLLAPPALATPASTEQEEKMG